MVKSSYAKSLQLDPQLSLKNSFFPPNFSHVLFCVFYFEVKQTVKEPIKCVITSKYPFP